MSALPALVLAVALEPTRILSVRTEAVEARQALTVVATGELGEVAVRREGGELVVRLAAEAPADLAPPAAIAPIEDVRIVREAGGLTLRVRVALEIPYEVRRNGPRLTVLFGEVPSPARQPASADLAELYKKILPVPPGDEQAGGQVVAPVTGEAPRGEDGGESEGWSLGFLKLRPSLAVSYVDAETTLLEAQPVKDQYFQIEPSLGLRFSVARGAFKADYVPRFRRASAFPLVGVTSHRANASLDLPLGPVIDLRLSDHFAKGILESNEVDPGREFFFRLGRFTRNQVDASLRIRTGGRFGFNLGGTFNRVRFSEPAGFFSYESESARGGLEYELGPELRAGLSYVYDRTPPADERPEAESRAHSADLTVSGEILPLLSGSVSAGYRDQTSPRAAEGGRRFRGLVVGASLRSELSRASSLLLAASRSTQLSAFEQNAFYVSTSGQAELTLPLPLSFALKGGAGYYWNRYKTRASGLGEPREDRIFGWSTGLGRAVTRWAFVRADYRRERRESNLDAFDNTTRALIVQLGIGLIGAPAR